MPSTTPQDAAAIDLTGGVDTHRDTHTTAVIDMVGRVLGTEQFPATPAGYAALLAWMCSFGRLGRVRGRGHRLYDAGPARQLRERSVEVVEVDRPDRKSRRFQGKTDPIDAIAAAKSALAGERTGVPSGVTAGSRRCGTCGWLASVPSPGAPTPSARSRR